jgi:hypothetical protein
MVDTSVAALSSGQRHVLLPLGQGVTKGGLAIDFHTGVNNAEAIALVIFWGLEARRLV